MRSGNEGKKRDAKRRFCRRYNGEQESVEGFPYLASSVAEWIFISGWEDHLHEVCAWVRLWERDRKRGSVLECESLHVLARCLSPLACLLCTPYCWLPHKATDPTHNQCQ